MSDPGFVKIIRTRAPLRLNDIGGWTDTWFSGGGKVLNMAVSPQVEVEIKVFENREKTPERVLLHAQDYGVSFLIDPDKPDYQFHPLLQAAVHSLPVPENVRLDIRIRSPFPPGSAVGTSASVCVSLLGALAALQEIPFSRDEFVSLAHRVETDLLELQSGIQDQICAVYGGISYIRMPSYPDFEVECVDLPSGMEEELDRRLCLIYLGDAHRSSDLHELVIASLEKKTGAFAQIEILRGLAEKAKTSLSNGDIFEFGRLMVENNEVQRRLHPQLISAEADAVAAMAGRYGAVGWKVNGAGGNGGSVTLLASLEETRKSAMIKKIEKMGKGIKHLPVHLSHQGLTVEK